MTAVTGRTCSFERAGVTVPAVLWLPDRPPRAIVLAGHGFTLHKRALYPTTLPQDLTARGFAVAAIDAPAHGDRRPDGGRDRVDREWRAHWRAHGGDEVAADYAALLDRLLPDLTIDNVAYWGLSLATQYGLAFLAREPRVRAAVLGLSDLPGPRVAAYAAAVACPVFFIQQLDDEVAPRTRSDALFQRIAGDGKILRASAGRHMDVPTAVFEEAYEFLSTRLA